MDQEGVENLFYLNKRKLQKTLYFLVENAAIANRIFLTFSCFLQVSWMVLYFWTLLYQRRQECYKMKVKSVIRATKVKI